MGSCLPLYRPDYRALMATAIRMRTLVLEEIRSSACALIVACRPLPVAVPVPVDNPRGALAPLGYLADVVPLSDWRSPPLTPALPTGRIVVSRCIALNGVNFQWIAYFLTSPPSSFSCGGGDGGCY